MSPAQLILIGVILVMMLGIAAAVMMNQQAQRKKRMMNMIHGHGAGRVKGASKKDVQNKRRDEIARNLKKLKEEDEKSSKKKKKNSISNLIEQAGLTLNLRQFWIYTCVCVVVAVSLSVFMGASLFVSSMVGIISFFGVPRFILRFMAKRRQKKFLQEFPDALEATVRLLKAGMPVSEAISMISREFSGPVGEEMTRIYDKQKIGVPLHEAAKDATRRMPLTEMEMFATGLAIQAQTGSSLSEVLTNLSNVIRSRFKLKRKIKALSSEAIASAGIIGSLPNLLGLGMYFVNPDYLNILFTETIGNILLAGAVLWMLVGIAVMKVMINFKI